MNNCNDRALQDAKSRDNHDAHKPAPTVEEPNTDAKSRPADWLMRRFMAVV